MTSKYSRRSKSLWEESTRRQIRRSVGRRIKNINVTDDRRNLKHERTVLSNANGFVSGQHSVEVTYQETLESTSSQECRLASRIPWMKLDYCRYNNSFVPLSGTPTLLCMVGQPDATSVSAYMHFKQTMHYLKQVAYKWYEGVTFGLPCFHYMTLHGTRARLRSWDIYNRPNLETKNVIMLGINTALAPG